MREIEETNQTLDDELGFWNADERREKGMTYEREDCCRPAPKRNPSF